MATKYPAGSAGEKEAKAYKIFLIVAGVVTAALLGVLFVFNTEVRTVVKGAGGFLNVLGGLCVAGSWVMLYKGTKAGEEGSSGWTLGWIGLIGLGFLIATGLYGASY